MTTGFITLMSIWLDCYNKVYYNPLTYKEAGKCLCDLIMKVTNVIQKMFKDNMYHGDLRLPNICFDKEFNPKLIDLDNGGIATMSKLKERIVNDQMIFIRDLIANLDITGS